MMIGMMMMMNGNEQMEYQKWLDGLKEGDTVVLSVNRFGNAIRWSTKVSTITKGGYITVLDYTFRRNGQPKKKYGALVELIMPTSELGREVIEKERRNRCLDLISIEYINKLRTLPIEKLEKIVELIEKELKDYGKTTHYLGQRNQS